VRVVDRRVIVRIDPQGEAKSAESDGKS